MWDMSQSPRTCFFLCRRLEHEHLEGHMETSKNNKDEESLMYSNDLQLQLPVTLKHIHMFLLLGLNAAKEQWIGTDVCEHIMLVLIRIMSICCIRSIFFASFLSARGREQLVVHMAREMRDALLKAGVSDDQAEVVLLNMAKTKDDPAPVEGYVLPVAQRTVVVQQTACRALGIYTSCCQHHVLNPVCMAKLATGAQLSQEDISDFQRILNTQYFWIFWMQVASWFFSPRQHPFWDSLQYYWECQRYYWECHESCMVVLPCAQDRNKLLEVLGPPGHLWEARAALLFPRNVLWNCSPFQNQLCPCCLASGRFLSDHNNDHNRGLRGTALWMVTMVAMLSACDRGFRRRRNLLSMQESHEFSGGVGCFDSSRGSFYCEGFLCGFSVSTAALPR